jgi:hypothetical protein
MAALAGAGAGAAVGGITGALIGMGIPEYEAKRYEGKIKDGNILMFVHTRDGAERDRAKELFTNAGAGDISYTGEAAAAQRAEPEDWVEAGRPVRVEDDRGPAPMDTDLASDEAGPGRTRI